MINDCDAFMLERVNRFGGLFGRMTSQLQRLAPDLGDRERLNRLQTAKFIITAMKSAYDVLTLLYPFLPVVGAQWRYGITLKIAIFFFALDNMLGWLERSVVELEAM